MIDLTQANLATGSNGGILVTTVSESRMDAGTGSAAPAHLDLRVGRGEFCAVVRPTGCGKSTTLALAAGMEMASEGSVKVFRKEVAGITPNPGFMFQADAILPRQSVLDNVAAGRL